jgi:hypothetical protein
MYTAAIVMMGLATIFQGVLNIYQRRTIDRLRATLKVERENHSGHMQDTVNALELVVKYQNYIKENGIPLP